MNKYIVYFSFFVWGAIVGGVIVALVCAYG